MSKRRASAVARVGEIDRLLGPDVAPAERGLLERHAVLMALGDIEEGAAVGPEHPFVGREDQEVRIELRARPSPSRPRCAWHRPATPRPARRSASRHPLEVDARRRPTSAPRRSRPAPPAARPAARWPPAPPPSSRRRPAAHRLDGEAPALGARVIHSSTGEEWSFCSTSTREPRGIGSTLPPSPRRSRPRRSARRRRHRRRSARAAAGGRARAAGWRSRVDSHGWPLRATAGAAGLLRGERQRAPGGGVEIADIARDIEQSALRGQHADAVAPYLAPTWRRARRSPLRPCARGARRDLAALSSAR